VQNIERPERGWAAIMQEEVVKDSRVTKPQPRVYTIVLNYNNFSDTVETLQSALMLAYTNNHILLVENSTKKEIPERIRQLFPELEIIENEKNLGYAGGNNAGIRYAMQHGSEYIFVINNDIALQQDVLDKLVLAMESDKTAAACQPLVTYYDDKDKIWSAGSQLFLGYPRLYYRGKRKHGKGTKKPPFGLVGCALLFRAQSLQEIGLFDESLFLLQEETDWCMRAVKMGFNLLVVCDAVVHHKVSVTLGYFSKEYLYYVSRNWLLVGKRHNSRSGYAYILLTELFTRIPYYLYQLARKKQIAMMKYYYYGLMDGLHGISGVRDFQRPAKKGKRL
jgi:GT2 family glycosyltransferase